MMSKKQKFLEWLEHESKEAHDAETFSRNGESIDYDTGIFAGREEAFNEIIVKINSDEEILKCGYCPVLTGEDAKRFRDYIKNPPPLSDEAKKLFKDELSETMCFNTKRKQRNEKIIKEKLLRELRDFVSDWYSEDPYTKCYIDKGVMITKLEEMNGGCDL